MIKSIVEASKIFDSTIRIQILASLSTSSLTYNQLKAVCQCADGAMTNHTNKLEKAGYITVKKEFVNRRPQTTYSITKLGVESFQDFVAALNKTIRDKEKEK